MIGLANNLRKMKYIYHHLGLGDHIICNGLVRSIIKNDELYTIFVKPHNKITVEFMYRDLPNLYIIEADDHEVNEYLRNKKIDGSNLILAGFHSHPGSVSFDESFYLQNNIPFENRWETFKVLRNLDDEKKLFDKFNVKPKEYIFIHDDDRYRVNLNKIEHNYLPIVKCEKGHTENLFDYLTLIENSLSCHTIESSLQFIIDSLNLNNENYVHRYARPLTPWTTPFYKNVKKIIE